MATGLRTNTHYFVPLQGEKRRQCEALAGAQRNEEAKQQVGNYR
jgi:hypothetical protein